MNTNLFEAGRRLVGGLFVVCWSLSLLACGTVPDQFGKLNLKKWRGDRGGCMGTRSALEADFRAEIPNLKGKTANTIGEWLGRPDANILADRNQKFYVYYLERGPQCDKVGAKSSSRSVAIRMSAIGLATEITFQNGLP
ncbi:hypothetical protein GGR92_005375 [Spirosoma lacussanchae]|uniref:hypothetical protein n=1 Tax=Spirosoma lacussanchae TaxID=1884249 RepID=UPI001FE8CC4D|nr:hypothetical protein [Spirosoma lacussanchae]